MSLAAGAPEKGGLRRAAPIIPKNMTSTYDKRLPAQNRPAKILYPLGERCIAD